MKTTSCMCFNSNYEETICMPVLQRHNMDPKDCLIQLLTVYFSHRHIRLNLHSVARCEMGKTVVCIHVWDVSSVHRRIEKRVRSRRLCSMDLFSMPCHPSPLTPRQLHQQWGVTSVPCFYLAVITGGGKSDCILMPPVVKPKNNMHWDLQLFPILCSFLILWSQNSQSIKLAWI